MSHSKTKSTTDGEGFKSVPLKLTEREREIILALRLSKGEEPERTASTAARGTKTSRPGRPYVAPSGGAGTSEPAKKTYASATRGKDTKVEEKTEKKFVRTEVPEEVIKRVNDTFDGIDLNIAKNFTQLSKVKVDGTPIYYFKKHLDSSDTFKCMAGEIHGDAISKFVKELDAPAFVIIRSLMLKLYAWLKANNATVLAELKSNEQWSRCFRSDVLESAEVVFMKDRTKILLGKTASAKPFDDSDSE
jgi:hypothetical protein